MIKTIKVSDKGQIAIPQSIRESLGIQRGDDLIILEVGGKLLIEKQKKVSEMVKDSFKDILHFSEQSLGSVWNNTEDEIWSSYLKNAN